MLIPSGKSSKLRATVQLQTLLSQQINFQRDISEKMLLLQGSQCPGVGGRGNVRLGG